MTLQSQVEADKRIDNFDVVRIKNELFDRSELNQTVLDTLAANGVALDVMLAQIQVGVIGAMHRDWVELRRSRIQSILAEVNRADSDASNGGSIDTNTADWLGRIMT